MTRVIWLRMPIKPILILLFTDWSSLGIHLGIQTLSNPSLEVWGVSDEVITSRMVSEAYDSK
jgi:hypothetical protein